MGVSANLGTKVNRRKRAVRLSPNVMENISAEWGDEGDGVVIEVDDMRKRAKEVLFDELFLRYPKFLTAVIDNGILMGMTVDGVSAGRGSEEVRKKVG